jgi:hypothetical protein
MKTGYGNVETAPPPGRVSHVPTASTANNKVSSMSLDTNVRNVSSHTPFSPRAGRPRNAGAPAGGSTVPEGRMRRDPYSRRRSRDGLRSSSSHGSTPATVQRGIFSPRAVSISRTIPPSCHVAIVDTIPSARPRAVRPARCT